MEILCDCPFKRVHTNEIAGAANQRIVTWGGTNAQLSLTESCSEP